MISNCAKYRQGVAHGEIPGSCWGQGSSLQGAPQEITPELRSERWAGLSRGSRWGRALRTGTEGLAQGE